MGKAGRRGPASTRTKMGQYHIVVNLDKKEFISPHKLGDGLKLLEQMNSHGGTMAALWVLLACSNGRGGGDIPDGVDYKFDERKNKVVEVVPDREYRRLAKEYIGRWAGDRIAIIGDYADDSDLPAEFAASTIYRDCMEGKNGWRDISDGVVPIVEVACGVRIERTEGWREKHLIGEEKRAVYLCPDFVIGIQRS
ncbi:hypothetical protein SAMN00808754_1677 [Thermanaeromonas toyohensis ToBE]|uniref:Uncharacterized protein n=1 Tax=Thermanaeromonas toyohensis ToBE TaxID=698762 RepID=A0A1W1VVE6_9FIRM|nr:hypothetical protein SAMN00808754_1677 [Thermanaeromonas toyohensis ToBE]